MQGMKVLFAVSEFAPFARTGDLAETASGLCRALREAGADCRVIMPCYRGIEAERKEVIGGLPVPVSSRTVYGHVWETTSPCGTPIYLVDQPTYFDRAGLYRAEDGDVYTDNAERFIFFARAVVEFMKRGPFQPDVLHANDWFTGLAPVYMKTLYAGDQAIRSTKSVFTIHDIAYQGIFWHHDMHLTGFPWDLFRFDKLEFFGKLNFAKGGIVFADAVTTVSRTHAEEIRSDRAGCGLETTLARRGSDFRGISSGINTTSWDPAADPAIAAAFDATSLEGKTACRRALQRLGNLPEDDLPILAMIGPFTRRNGSDLAVTALGDLVGRGLRIVAMGEGEPEILDALRNFAKARPLEISLTTTPREDLHRRILAGADLLLLPARDGPGGLDHLRALRYGTLPVARRVGALADAIHEVDLDSGAGAGFLFVEPTVEALLSALDRALIILRHPDMKRRAIENAMATDVSWKSAAEEYLKLYESL